MIDDSVGDRPMWTAQSGMTTCLVDRIADSSTMPMPRVTRIHQYVLSIPIVVAFAAPVTTARSSTRSGTT